MTTMQAQRRRVKRFVRPLAKMPTWKAYEWIADAKPRTLAAALRAMQSCTETNCWFGDYRTAQVLLPVVMRHMPPNAGNNRHEAA